MKLPARLCKMYSKITSNLPTFPTLARELCLPIIRPWATLLAKYEAHFLYTVIRKRL